MGYEWLALASASLWAIAALISVKPARHLGAFAYSRWRMFLVSLMLGTMSLLTGGWQTLTASVLPLLAISGLVGIFVGDTALFACMNRLGQDAVPCSSPAMRCFPPCLGSGSLMNS